MTKLLANRLESVISAHYQYGFRKTRTIQDCIAWAYEFLFQCHRSKKPSVVLKLDFEKAFDKIEHGMILAILQKKGLGIDGVPGSNRFLDMLLPLFFLMAFLVYNSNAEDEQDKEIPFHPYSLFSLLIFCKLF